MDFQGMFKEKREHTRFRTLAVAELSYSDYPEILDRGVIIDISMGGMAFTSTRTFNIGDCLSILVPSRALNIIGKVKRIKEDEKYFMYGLEFNSNLESVKMRLSKWISQIYRLIICSSKNKSTG
ncbi:PilZ domain-containing protein [Elusimicrobiota bacterium]